jgi:hypothetical protein
MTTKKRPDDADPSAALSTMLANISVIAEAMNTEMGKLREYLSNVARALGGHEKELERLRGIKQRQIDELDAEIADRTNRLKGLANQVQTLKDGRAAILTQLEKAAPVNSP